MLENCKTAQERWGGVSEIIDKWLQERKELLVQYCNLSEIIEEKSGVTIGDLWTDTIMYSDGQKKSLTYIVKPDNQITYMITYQADLNQFDRYLSKAESIIKSFKLLKQPLLDFRDIYGNKSPILSILKKRDAS